MNLLRCISGRGVTNTGRICSLDSIAKPPLNAKVRA